MLIAVIIAAVSVWVFQVGGGKDRNNSIYGVYNKYPDSTISVMIFDVVARNYDLFNSMIANKHFEFKHSWDLLRLYSVFSMQYSQLRSDIPFFQNGQVLSEYFEKFYTEGRELNEEDLSFLTKVRDDYFKLASYYNELVNSQTGELRKEIISNINKMDRTLIDQVNMEMRKR